MSDFVFPYAIMYIFLYLLGKAKLTRLASCLALQKIWVVRESLYSACVWFSI